MTSKIVISLDIMSLDYLHYPNKYLAYNCTMYVMYVCMLDIIKNYLLQVYQGHIQKQGFSDSY